VTTPQTSPKISAAAVIGEREITDENAKMGRYEKFNQNLQ